MTYFDISKVESLLPDSFLFKVNKPALVSYYRSDYHGDTKLTLDESVRKTVKEQTGRNLEGPIRLLTHMRYFGYCFNPVSFYYCFDKSDKKLEMIMAEVTNTPWNERHCYFITAKKNKSFRQGLKKQFHVSPFWDMDHDYDWYFSDVSDTISVNMINYKDEKKVFDATLSLSVSKKLTNLNLFLSVLRFPFSTLMVYLRIHYQAFKLWVKGATFYDHPKYEENKK
tara:strand:+ start:19086 stop:19760 length:675 start_codon:yes stop_codon:yes gene_type:complete